MKLLPIFSLLVIFPLLVSGCSAPPSVTTHTSTTPIPSQSPTPAPTSTTTTPDHTVHDHLPWLLPARPPSLRRLSSQQKQSPESVRQVNVG